MTSHQGPAIVLSGGGAHGAYALGVLEALFGGRWQRGAVGAIDPALYTGTSVGAFSAAYLAQHDGRAPLDSVRALEELWLNRIASTRRRPNGVYRIRGNPHGYLGAAAGTDSMISSMLGEVIHDTGVWARSWLQRGLDLATSGEGPGRSALRSLDLRDLVSTQPLGRLIAETIDTSALLDPRAKTVKIATTRWDQGEAVLFGNRPGPRTQSFTFADYELRPFSPDNVAKAIRASASIPGLFYPVQIDDEPFVDGGLVLNTPLHPALEPGIEEIHVIHFEHRLAQVPVGRAPSLIETIERIAVAVPGNILNWDFELARRNNQLCDFARQLEHELQGRPSGHDDPQSTSFDALRARLAAKTHLRIHRHFPRRKLGGAPSFFDFRRSRLIELIELGFDDAVRHDCERNGCIP